MVADSLYYNIGNFIYLGAQWFISVVLVRVGGFEIAGYFSLAMTVAGMFGMIAHYGMRSFQVSDIRNKFSNSSYLVLRIITSFAAFILCVLYCFLKQYDTISVISIVFYMLYKCVEAYSDGLSSIWQKNNNMLDVGLSLGIRGIANTVFFFFAYSFSKSITVSLFAMALASFATLILFDFPKSKKYINQAKELKNANRKQVALLLKFGFLTMVFVLLTSVLNGIPKLIIEAKLSTSLLGVFSSLSAPTIVISTFAIGILLPTAPKIADYYYTNQKKALLKLLFLCNTVIVAIGFVAEMLSLFIGKQAFAFVFGSEILPYFNLFYLLIIVSVFTALVNCFATFLIAVRKLKQLVAFSGMACTVVLIASLIFIPLYSVKGAAYALLIALGIQFIIESIYIRSLIQKMGQVNEKNI